MPKPILNAARIMPLIGQGVSAGVPQHVDVYLEGDSGTLTYALRKAIDGIRGEWSATTSR